MHLTPRQRAMIAQYEQARSVWQSRFGVEFNGNDDTDVLEAIKHNNELRNFALKLISMKEQLPSSYENGDISKPREKASYG